MKAVYRPFKYHRNLKIDKNNIQYSGIFAYKFESETEFITGIRKEGLHRLFYPKMKVVKTEKSIAHKLYIGIGLNVLTLKSITKGKTKNGYAKITILFTKPPVESTCASGKDSYNPIVCTHMISKGSGKDFNTLWYRPFTTDLKEEQFEFLKIGTKYKCVVLQKEELWINDGTPMVYEKGEKEGKVIIMIKPEIVELYDIDTPDENIKLNYFRLYTPIKTNK